MSKTLHWNTEIVFVDCETKRALGSIKQNSFCAWYKQINKQTNKQKTNQREWVLDHRANEERNGNE